MKILSIEDGIATISLEADHCAALARALRKAANETWDDEGQTTTEILACLFESLNHATAVYGYMVPGKEWTLAIAREEYQLPS